MPTSSQDKEFAEEMKDSIQEVIISKSALDNAINWIGDNLDPDQVFSEEKLKDWAESYGYKKEE